jgi:uncharacterized flavoprotein (TIGR03862 family)
MRSVAVVGAGPAGLAAAEVMAAAGLAVTVYERMPSAGRKLLIAGRGGLNLTHSEPLEGFLARYHPAEPAASAVRAYPPEALRAWCEGLGQETFVGTSGRVFPRALKASPLLRAWLARLDGLGVRLAVRHRWTGFAGDALAFETPDGRREVRADAVVLALGGASWPRLGSDGAWAGVLAGIGVPLAPFAPANMGFRVAWSEPFRVRHAGAPLKRLALTFAGRTVRGEALIDAEGIEGGAVYALSRPLREAIAAEGSATLAVDLRPDLSEAALAARIAGARRGQSLSTTLRKAGLDPAAAGLVREAGLAAGGLLAGGLPAGPALAALIKGVRLRLLAPAPIDRAISTAGGVRAEALDARLMLRARPGTFVAGEMLDWEAPTGGYLLQGAFATGRAAAAGVLGHLSATG